MFPREIVWYIFSFQERYRYFLTFNTLLSLKKIKETLRKYHPISYQYIDFPSGLFQAVLPITKNKQYELLFHSIDLTLNDFNVRITEKYYTFRVHKVYKVSVTDRQECFDLDIRNNKWFYKF